MADNENWGDQQMSDGLNENLGRHLDLMRRFGVGSNAVLIPLTFASGRGYFALSEPIKGGWSLELGDLDQLQTLCIVEQSWVSNDLLSQVRGFSVNGKVYEVVSGYRIVAPESFAILKEWKFPVAPTGEDFEQ